MNEKVKSVLQVTLKITITILSIIFIIVAIRWLQLKGMVGFFSGMGIMSYLFLTENKLFIMFIEMLGGKVDDK